MYRLCSQPLVSSEWRAGETGLRGRFSEEFRDSCRSANCRDHLPRVSPEDTETRTERRGLHAHGGEVPVGGGIHENTNLSFRSHQTVSPRIVPENHLSHQHIPSAYMGKLLHSEPRRHSCASLFCCSLGGGGLGHRHCPRRLETLLPLSAVWRLLRC